MERSVPGDEAISNSHEEIASLTTCAYLENDRP